MDSLAARSAAHRSWAMTRDRRARTAPGRNALLARFEAQARELLGPQASPSEIEASAVSLRKAYFTDLARKSAKARAAR